MAVLLVSGGCSPNAGLGAGATAGNESWRQFVSLVGVQDGDAMVHCSQAVGFFLGVP